MWKAWLSRTILEVLSVVFILVLLVPVPVTPQYRRDVTYSRQRDYEALQKLKNIKRRVSYRVISSKRRHIRYCRRWNDPCVPWTSDPQQSCCHRRLVCRCNLWMQNCRCVARAWGK
ncbi:uncharacterized protein LOC121372072 [Gigantopelta aegis]|uniref:uncharacterized protein LOC121372072 n=1 Tax=Gigantopelta aegis TaxID=1735272 RepID=UPI001B888B48|nr:uncharacterized protein LOC121372072 [Gigantopelta aegis]